jgi:hypothetical protein
LFMVFPCEEDDEDECGLVSARRKIGKIRL